jgi:uncharacterized protein
MRLDPLGRAVAEQQAATGRIAGLYRYPVKGCGGEAVSSLDLDDEGIAGDRQFMVIDEKSSVVSMLHTPRLVLIGASLRGGVLRLSADGAADIEVDVFAEEGLITADLYRDPVPARLCDSAAGAWLSDVLGTPVRLVVSGSSFARANIVGQNSRTIPAKSNNYVNAAPILVVGAASLAALESQVGGPVEMARFRPNVVVEGFDPHAEDGWGRLEAGGQDLEFMGPCERCAMIQVDPVTARPGPEPMRTLKTVRHFPGGRFSGVFFGAYYQPRTAGRLSVGDLCVARTGDHGA